MFQGSPNFEVYDRMTCKHCNCEETRAYSSTRQVYADILREVIRETSDKLLEGYTTDSDFELAHLMNVFENVLVKKFNLEEKSDAGTPL